jgi:hypothetical protein
MEYSMPDPINPSQESNNEENPDQQTNFSYSGTQTGSYQLGATEDGHIEFSSVINDTGDSCASVRIPTWHFQQISFTELLNILSTANSSEEESNNPENNTAEQASEDSDLIGEYSSAGENSEG